MRPLLKVAGMISYKIEKLAKYVVKDFPFDSIKHEMALLQGAWRDITASKMAMKVQDLQAVGTLVYEELCKFRVEARDERRALCHELGLNE
jgi:hypothetical protein